MFEDCDTWPPIHWESRVNGATTNFGAEAHFSTVLIEFSFQCNFLKAKWLPTLLNPTTF